MRHFCALVASHNRTTTAALADHARHHHISHSPLAPTPTTHAVQMLEEMEAVEGVVAHGLFDNMAKAVVVAKKAGEPQLLEF